MIKFTQALDYVLRNECDQGDFYKVTFNEKDKGGITKFGISLRFLKSIPAQKLRDYNIYVIDEPGEHDIKTLTESQARTIYLKEFWEKAPFDQINVQSICEYIFDMAVNLGISPAIKCAQRATIAVTKDRSFVVDGIMGAKTIHVINECGTDLIYSLRAERACYYIDIVQRNPTQEIFLNGWLNRAYK